MNSTSNFTLDCKISDHYLKKWDFLNSVVTTHMSMCTTQCFYTAAVIAFHFSSLRLKILIFKVELNEGIR